jgi:hypothetical protein
MSTTRRRTLLRRGRHDSGASAVEYALILAGRTFDRRHASTGPRRRRNASNNMQGPSVTATPSQPSPSASDAHDHQRDAHHLERHTHQRYPDDDDGSAFPAIDRPGRSSELHHDADRPDLDDEDDLRNDPIDDPSNAATSSGTVPAAHRRRPGCSSAPSSR